MEPLTPNHYLHQFSTDNGKIYGIRYGTPDDAKEISSIYQELYSNYYVNPLVYNIEELKKKLENNNNYWIIGEKLGLKKEVFGVGLLEKRGNKLYASKAVIKMKYQGKKLATKLWSFGSLLLLKSPEFKNIVRLDADVRGINIRSQKIFERAGGIAYAFIPGFNNFADKRGFKINEGRPFYRGLEEPAFLYAAILWPLWKNRKNDIYLIDDENFSYIYTYMSHQYRTMKKDNLIIREPKNSEKEDFILSKDLYKGIINIEGYLKEQTLNSFIQEYSGWRIIEWRIPTTIEGLNSMKYALKYDFSLVGYDIGSIENEDGSLVDSIVMCYFSHSLDKRQLEVLDLTEKNKILAEKVLNSFANKFK